MTKTIPELREDVARLKTQLETAERHLTYALRDATRITVDDIVNGTGRFAGDEFKVTFIDVRFEGKPWLIGVKRRANGLWGTGERHLFDDWEQIAK